MLLLPSFILNAISSKSIFCLFSPIGKNVFVSFLEANNISAGISGLTLCSPIMAGSQTRKRQFNVA